MTQRQRITASECSVITPGPPLNASHVDVVWRSNSKMGVAVSISAHVPTGGSYTLVKKSSGDLFVSIIDTNRVGRQGVVLETLPRARWKEHIKIARNEQGLADSLPTTFPFEAAKRRISSGWARRRLVEPLGPRIGNSRPLRSALTMTDANWRDLAELDFGAGPCLAHPHRMPLPFAKRWGLARRQRSPVVALHGARVRHAPQQTVHVNWKCPWG